MLLIEAIKDGSRDGLKILPPLFIHNQAAATLRRFTRFTMENKAYMYVLECGWLPLHRLHNGVQARLKKHQAGKGAKYTRARLPVTYFTKKNT